jgi:hypothetical protein
VRKTITTAELLGAKQVVIEMKEAIPVTEAEVDFMLHWAGDLAADLMNDDDVGG